METLRDMYCDNSTAQRKKASNRHANLPLEMYSFTLYIASARAIIKVSGHQHQWFQVFPRWLQCKTVHFQG